MFIHLQWHNYLRLMYKLYTVLLIIFCNFYQVYFFTHNTHYKLILLIFAKIISKTFLKFFILSCIYKLSTMTYFKNDILLKSMLQERPHFFVLLFIGTLYIKLSYHIVAISKIYQLARITNI